MTAQKPIFNFINNRDGSVITFRQSLKAYAPAEEQMKKLIVEITGIIGKQTTPEFEDRVAYLITFLRWRIYNHVTAYTVTDLGKEVQTFKRLLKNVKDFIDSDENPSDELYSQFSISRLLKETEEERRKDVLGNLYTSIEDMLETCEEIKKRIKGAKSDFTPNDMRQILAEELARELDKIGVKLTKSRNGIFEKCLRAVLEAVRCSIHGEKVAAAVPEDLFFIASAAIDAYPNKEPYSLLAFD